MGALAVTPLPAGALTNLQSELTPGHRYLLYFNLPRGVSVDVKRKFSDYVNMADTWVQQYGPDTDVTLIGTTVAENVGGTGQDQLVAAIQVNGTPLLAAVTPIVAIALIVAGVYLVIHFSHAIDATISKVGKTVGDIGDAVKDLAQPAGQGLKYGLAFAGVGVAVIGSLVLLSYSKVGA